MKPKYLLAILLASSAGAVFGQTSFTSTDATGSWNTTRWNNTTDAAPYTSAYTANNAVNFTSGTYNIAGMGETINVGNVTVADGVIVNFTAAANTYATNGAVRTITVGTGGLLDFAGQSFSTAAGTGFIKDGAGVLALSGNTYAGGFTLNNGTVIARGVNALGAGGVLNLNGGTIASNAHRDFTDTKFTGGINVGGNVQFGEFASNVSIAGDSRRVTFANNVSLGSSNRTLTLGNDGNHAFSGVISNSGSGGITFAANANTGGRFEITNTANTFTGDITITGGEVRFTSDGSMGNADNDIVIDGGRFATVNSGIFTLGAGRNVFIGDTAGTSISTPGSGTFTINTAIADISGKTGELAKQGGGALELGGVSTYTGNTSINNGILRLTTGDDRLPTGTVVSLGQASSTNLGTLDLNGNSQAIAGLNSTTGNNAETNTNVVTSATAATLTINAATSTTHVYSAGTAADSGNITGSVALAKLGEGTQVLGGSNTYTGTTSVTQGTLLIEGSHTGGDTYTVGSAGVIGGNGSITSSLHFAAGAGFAFNPFATLTIDGLSVSFDGFSVANLFGLDSTVGVDTYVLMNGIADFDLTNVSNMGLANAFDLGGGKSAYFEAGSLNLVVIPEPSTALLGGIGALMLLRRRR